MTITRLVWPFLMLDFNSTHRLLTCAKSKPTSGLARQPFLLRPPLLKGITVGKKTRHYCLCPRVPSLSLTSSTRHNSYANVVLVRTHCVQVTLTLLFLCHLLIPSVEATVTPF